jgi:CDP-glucose 4,6-dehydratase
MGGYDPYSSSKGACEIAINSWRRSFFNYDDHKNHEKSIASVRAGNVIGGGDWTRDRIISDCIKALEENRPIELRNSKSVRPWQHVLEPLSGYLLLGEKLWNDSSYSEGWNFGPDLDSIINVGSIAEKLIKFYGKGTIKDISDPNALHEANLLILDISKSRFKLGWKPRLSIDKALEMTVEWYKNYNKTNVYDLCLNQIREFIKCGGEI